MAGNPLKKQRFFERRHFRRFITAVVDLFAIASSLPLAYWLRFGNPQAVFDRQDFVPVFLVLVSARLVFLQAFHLRRMLWRYTSIHDLRRIVLAATLATLVAVSATALMTRLQGVPRSVFFLEWGIYIFLAAGARASYRVLHETRKQRAGRILSERTHPTIVIGAGAAGTLIAKDLAQNTRFGERVAAFLDDDPAKREREIMGVLIQGPVERLPNVMTRLETRRVYIAIPSADSAQMRRIVRICENAGAEFSTLPSLGEIAHGRAITHQLRPVRLEDLLARETVMIDVESISRWLRGKRVVVTGAGGSIGSELCRQLLGFGIGHLTLLDQNEFQTYSLQAELSTALQESPHRSVIGSVTDRRLVADVLTEERPDVVFHAAAYKHVNLMELNPRAALTSNVLGTYRLAELAAAKGVPHFVLISTDKAVRPTSVMGATKALAEEICVGLGRRPSTAFHVVRFGNVMGSSGSVIPVFERQLAAGGPLTVTHPEATRFFMTIPEAVRLTLQAVAGKERGHIAVLDMGKPLRILDLAEQMIQLAGKRPYADVPITFTGLRPGEKLHEELWNPSEVVVRSDHPRIMRAVPRYRPAREPEDIVSAVASILESDSSAKQQSRAVVALANPSDAGMGERGGDERGDPDLHVTRPLSDSGATRSR